MSFYKTKHGQIISILVICIFVCGYYIIKFEKQNKHYEEYINYNVENILADMNQATIRSKAILDKSNSDNEISKENLKNLTNEYRNFVLGIQKLPYIYSIVQNEKYVQKYYNINYSNNFFTLFETLIRYNENVQLNRNISMRYNFTNDDKLFFNQLYKMTNGIMEVFNGKHYELYKTDSLKIKENWIEIFKLVDTACAKNYD